MKAAPLATFVDRLLSRIASGRVAILFIFHAVVFSACYALAMLVRFDFTIPPNHQAIFKGSLPIVVAIQLLVGLLFGFYRGWWRYVGVADVIRLFSGLATSTAILALIWYGAWLTNIPLILRQSSRGALLIDFTFSLLALMGARIIVRITRDRFRTVDPASGPRRVIIVGAGDAGETLAREIEHRPQIGMRAVAFVDDQRNKWGSVIRGIKVTGPISNIDDIADRTEADLALIAIPSASGKRLREIIQHLSSAGLPFETIPGIDQLVNGTVQVSELRPVKVEDLLRRDRIQLPGDAVGRLLRGKRVVVTGAGGTIGSELASQVLRFGPECLVLLERSEFALYEVRKRLIREAPQEAERIRNALLDVQDRDSVRHLLQSVRPDIVLHAAAHKHVPLGEEHPSEYIRNNTLATKSLAELSEEMGVLRFVLISTDKAINPSSVMGASKRAAEILLLDIGQRAKMLTMVVRFGNVIGSSGSVIPLFMEQIAAGGPVTVTDPDVTRYFLSTSEAVSLVLQAATLAKQGEVFTLDMGEPIRIIDLARDLIRLSTRSEDEIPITITGLRPGEKLFEELRLDGESSRPTVHPQIVVTELSQPDALAVARWTSRMEIACRSKSSVIELLCELIPAYAPSMIHEMAIASVASRRGSRPLTESRPDPLVKETRVASAT